MLHAMSKLESQQLQKSSRGEHRSTQAGALPLVLLAATPCAGRRSCVCRQQIGLGRTSCSSLIGETLACHPVLGAMSKGVMHPTTLAAAAAAPMIPLQTAAALMMYHKQQMSQNDLQCTTGEVCCWVLCLWPEAPPYGQSRHA